MQDFWNAPPDYPDFPECCDDEMLCFPDGVCVCRACGLTARPAPDPPDDWIEKQLEGCDDVERCRDCGEPNANGCLLCDECGKKPCPHGNPWGECATCDYLADIAYDAVRESLR